MSRASLIGAYFVAGALSIGGGFAVANALTGSDVKDPKRAAEPAAYATEVALPVDPVEEPNTVRSASYGFRFRHPPDWSAGPRVDASVVASVARHDGVGCYVSVHAQELTADASGRPHNVSALLAALTPGQVAGAAFAGIPTKVESFAKANWLGQEARSFAITAAVPIAGTLRLEGYATLRRYGAVVLTCSAPDGLHANKDVQDAFSFIRKSFQFD